MKKYLFFLMLFGSKYSMAVETCDYVDESSDTEEVFSIDDYYDSNRPLEDYEIWKVKLDQFLIQYDDINVNIIGLAGLSEPYLDRIDEATGQPLISSKQKLSLINRLLESYDASYKSLIVAQDICNDKSLAFNCPSSKIQEKIIELTPDNLLVYLYDLDKAVNDDDAEMVDAILERMSQTQHAQLLIPYENSLKSILSAYINENPMPENPDHDWLKEYEDQLEDVDMKTFQYKSLLIAYKMETMTYMPAFRPMMLACEQYQEDSENCLKIAETLIDKSDSFIFIMLGYGLKEKMHEINGTAKEQQKAQLEYDKYKDYMSCIAKAQAVNDGIDLFFDPKVSDLYLHSTHEGTSLEQVALYLYDKHKELGAEGLTDPLSCGLRYVKQ